jgi:dTDP-4-dehydrorhamnose reductase
MTTPKQTKSKVLITGASGMLGRSLHRKLIGTEYQVKGLGFTRPFVQPPQHLPHRPLYRINLQTLNLLNHKETSSFLQEYSPDVIVHCAAERYPDAFEKNLEASFDLNVNCTRHLCNECIRLGKEKYSSSDSSTDKGPYFIYISTSYVFDGGVVSNVYPPYGPDSKAMPMNEYGKSKWEGECAVRDILNNDKVNGRGIIVRVPLLYGEDCADLNESPALEMMKVHLPSSHDGSVSAVSECQKIDDWALRFPTSVEDVSNVLKLMIDELLLKDPSETKVHAGTYHVSSPHGCTKFELLQLQSKLLGIPKELVEKRAVGNKEGSSVNAAPRPQCTQLDCNDTWTALRQEYSFCSLEDGMKRALYGFPERFS